MSVYISLPSERMLKIGFSNASSAPLRNQPKQTPLLAECVPGHPLERVAIHVDILGPLPEMENHTYIMVVADDYFPKWTESYSLPNQDAWTMAQKLVDEYSSDDLVRRKGSTRFRAINLSPPCSRKCAIYWEWEKLRTHPEGDGMVERFNCTCTLAAMLPKYVSQNEQNWDVHFPKVMMVDSCTLVLEWYAKFPPFCPIFGHDICLQQN